MRKTKVAVIFGGRSGEHDVSLMSARSVVGVLDPEKYDVLPVGITMAGTWLVADDPIGLLEELSEGDPDADGTSADVMDSLATVLATISDADVIFPVLHGPYGEDGTIQGLLEMVNVPYVGCGVLASSVAMDKAMSKQLFEAAGLPQVPYVVVRRQTWEDDADGVLTQVEEKLTYPLFVKPANLGSSVGISKVRTREELAGALTLASAYDRKLIVEASVEDAREIEVSVLGNDEPRASAAGEIRPGQGHEFYDYVAKYTEGETDLIIPAPIRDELLEEVQQVAIRAFKAVDGSGLARVDFLLDPETETLYLNELNTMPGFTIVSMYPKLWQESGVGYSELVERLIELACSRHAEKSRNRIRR